MIKSIRNIEFNIGAYSQGENSFNLTDNEITYIEKEQGIYSELIKLPYKET